jgi:8-hydroxy-5-deazaflavin:NADPH oxidoreductase
MRVGIIGAGMVGGTLAHLWTPRHEVRLSSRHPEELGASLQALGPTASAGHPLDAATWGEVVLLAVPFAAVAELPPEVRSALAGKVVIDAGNPFSARDGEAARAVALSGIGSGRWTAGQLPGARVVKAFNTVSFTRMVARDGVGVPLASDHADALEVASLLVRDAGMAPVIVGGLERAREFDPGTAPWNSGMNEGQLRVALGVG